MYSAVDYRSFSYFQDYVINQVISCCLAMPLKYSNETL